MAARAPGARWSHVTTHSCPTAEAGRPVTGMASMEPTDMLSRERPNSASFRERAFWTAGIRETQPP